MATEPGYKTSRMFKERANMLYIEEHQALAKYAEQHGRTWKSALRDAWMNASEPGTLQQLRNASYFGPMGLIAYKLPPIVPGSLAEERGTGKTYFVEQWNGEQLACHQVDYAKVMQQGNATGCQIGDTKFFDPVDLRYKNAA